MENIIENNKIIAEFLDWEFDDLSETFETPFLKLIDPHAFGDDQFSCKLQAFELEFHTDWNWLMGVVEKIYNTDIYHDTYIFYNSSMFSSGQIELTTKIEAVYNACIEFIKWYNSNN